MTAEDIQLLTEEALAETPGKAARVSLVIRQEASRWAILVVDGNEELALHVDVDAHTRPEDVRASLIRQARILF